MRYAHIVGWGKYVPSRILTNDDLAKTVDTSDAWIRERTGIAQRRIAADHESTSTLATNAALAALDVAGISASQLDLILVATATPENFFPSVACLVQDALGADKAGALDVSAACSGFVYAMAMASDAIKAGSANYVLVIGAEILSRILDWKDRNTCILFGDGAGAVVLQSSDQPGGVLSYTLRSDGSGSDYLYVPANGNGAGSTAKNAAMAIPKSSLVTAAVPAGAPSPQPETDAKKVDYAVASRPLGGFLDRVRAPKIQTTTPSPAPAQAASISKLPVLDTHYLHMNGREVYKFATRIFDKTLRDLMHKVGWVAAQVDVIVPHQANVRILESAMKTLGVPMEKCIVNLDRYGNTSAASIPIAITEAAETGRLRPHDKVLTIGFGGGLTWAAMALEWGVPKPPSRSQRTASKVGNVLGGFRSRTRKLLRQTGAKVRGTVER